MTIDKIGNINNIVETKNARPVSRSSNIKKSDKIEISVEGKKAAEMARYQQMVKDAPDIRREKVDEIKARIKSGEFDRAIASDQILEMVADKIAQGLLRK